VSSSNKVDLFGSSEASTSKVEANPWDMNSNDSALEMMVRLIKGMVEFC
jgi:hypothetical protein